MHADPYLNTDAGTMSPFEHGEVFVLDDGGEVNYQYCMRLFNSCGSVVLSIVIFVVKECA